VKLVKFALNRYNVNHHVQPVDPPPMPDARLEEHPFGTTPFELRQIWIVEVDHLAQILTVVDQERAYVDFSLSAFWSGNSLEDPGERLYGIAVFDDPSYPIDPRDRPIMIARESDQAEHHRAR
jgi:hypothetical protein